MNQSEHVYVVCEEGCEETGPFKIGTAKNVQYRVAGLRAGNWRKLVILRVKQFPNRQTAFSAEGLVHRRLNDHRLPARDWFTCAPSLAIDILDEMI